MAHPEEHGWVSEPGWGPRLPLATSPNPAALEVGRTYQGLSLEEQRTVLAAAEAKARVDITCEGHSIAGESQAQEAVAVESHGPSHLRAERL